MLKKPTGGTVINYGPTLPTDSTSFDGTLFYVTSGQDQGLHIFGLNQVDQSLTQVQDPGSGSGSGSPLNVSLFGGQPPSFYTNAGNLTSGTLAMARLPFPLDAGLFGGQQPSFYTNAGNLTSGTLATARLPFMPVQQGGGVGQNTSKINIGWEGTQLLLQVDATNFGGTWPVNITGTSATSNYANSAGGIAWTSVTGRPTALSEFTNDLPAGTAVTWASVTGHPTALSEFTNDLPAGTAVTWASLPGHPTALSQFTNDLPAGAVVTWASLPGHPTALSQFTNDLPGTISQIAYFARSTAPTGWLKANGALVSRTVYADLFAIVGTAYGVGDGINTFALPDLRGEFLRGWDDGRGVDNGRALGSTQVGQNLAHSHGGSVAAGGSHVHSGSTNTTGAHYHSGTINPAGAHVHDLLATDLTGCAIGTDRADFQANGDTYGVAVGWTATAGDHSHLLYIDTNGDHSHSLSIDANGDHTHALTIDSSGGTELRPRNVAFLACIKF